MKSVVRSVVRGINRLTVKFACETYGDVASLMPSGPCERCVGRAVEDSVPAFVRFGGDPSAIKPVI